MPARQWEDEESDSSASGSASPVAGATRRKFDDEEGEDSDVLESGMLPKTPNDEETEAQKRERLRRTEKDSDMKHAQDLFGDVGTVPAGRKATTAGAAVALDASDPTRTVNIADLPLFKPTTKTQFENLRNTLVPIIGAHSKKAHYAIFLQEFAKQLAKDLPSDQVKKVASTLTALSNERMKEEKAAQGGGKKTKASKNKTSLVANRADVIDTKTYEDDGFGDDDFM
ncbi:Eukaryotic translation initiation factor 3 subunit J like protein [Verticillium longisporum]|nr:Eukaryotic translation initiation factor 3 subunit J like protein [Verticillium longisporum]